MSYLKRNTAILWQLLQAQFGGNYPSTPQGKVHFKQAFQKQLGRVLAVYPEAKLEPITMGLILKPSLTHIKR